jgi:hypothetical protein
MSRFRILFAALLALVVSAPAQAYWEYGHQTIAAIAWANITPHSRAEIGKLLADQAALDTPSCPARTIEEASVWPDCVKPIKNADGKSRFGYAYTWHFQDVDVCKPFDLTGPCKDGNCVSAQITRQAALLRDRHTPRIERLQALLFLVHFVGDLHQPLHAGERNDQGGNKVKATYGIYTTPRLNLHSVWDGLLAERAITTGGSLVHRYPAAVRAAIAKGDVTDWSRESWQVAHDVAYASALGGEACAPEPDHVTLDAATIAAIVPAARLEVERGGLRLAKMLDAAFR